MNTINRRTSRRRGFVAVLAALSMPVLLGFAVLAIDTAWISSAKLELQVATDYCALATAGYIAHQPYNASRSAVSAEARAYGSVFMGNNPVAGRRLQPQSLRTGTAIRSSNGRVVGFSPSNGSYDAVKVDVSMSGSQSLGAVLGNFFGYQSYSPSATAIVLLDDRFAGYTPPDGIAPSPLLPFTVAVEVYEQGLKSGPDGWSWNGTSPSGSSDGVPEIWIYPDVTINGNGNGNGNEDGAGGGNFGTLNIGINNQSTQDLGDQIANGLSRTELYAEFGTEELSFVDTAGDPISHSATGNPGISGGMSSYVEQRVGEVVGFFVHDGVVLNGQNAVFNLITIRFGRLMEVDLTRGPDQMRIVIQPEVYSGPGVRTQPNAPHSEGMVLVVGLGA